MEKFYGFRTDLAVESADTGEGVLPDGVLVQEETKDGINTTIVEIKTDGASLRLGRPKGVYITLEGELDNATFEDVLTEHLKQLLPSGAVLVVGLGNRKITPDILGPHVANKVMATKHFPRDQMKAVGLENLRDVCTIAPGAMGETGMECALIIAALLKEIKFSAVVAVDALAARSMSRLGKTVQLSNTGISPGSGVHNRRESLSFENLGVPVYSIGIPTVIDLNSATEGQVQKEYECMIVTSRDIDVIMEKGARLIATSLNCALQNMIPKDVVRELM